jgi:polar amino acid transport system substrate-binding protein
MIYEGLLCSSLSVYNLYKKAAVMKKLLTTFSLLFYFSLSAEEKKLEILTFNYPPVMGESSISKNGILVDLVIASFAASGVSVSVVYLPVRRAIKQISLNQSVAFIGVKNTIPIQVQPDIVEYPFFVSRFVVFYKKKRFPDGFEFHNLSELKKYSIGVLSGGITDIIGNQNGLNLDGVNSLEQIFSKVNAGRNDLGVASEFSAKLFINTLFKKNAGVFTIYTDVPYYIMPSVLLLNRRHPDFAYYEPKLKNGMKIIALNGQWTDIIEKFYGKCNIPYISKKLFENAISRY